MIQRLVLKYSEHRSRNSLTQKRRNLLWYLKELDKLIDERVLKYEELWMKERKVQAIKEIEEWLKESEMQTQKSLVSEGAALEAILVSEGATLEASLIIEGAALEASLVTEGIALDENSVAQQCIVDSRTSSEQQDKCNISRNECSRSENEHRSSDNESNGLGNDADADIGPSYDGDKVYEIEMDDPNITIEEYIRLEEEKAQSYGETFNWQTATFAIVYNDGLTSKPDFETEPPLSSEHINEFETSMPEYDEEERNSLYFNDLFPFNVIHHDDLKSEKDNDDNGINIIQSPWVRMEILLVSSSNITAVGGGGVAVMRGSEGGGGKGGDEIWWWGCHGGGSSGLVVGRDCGDDVGVMEVMRWSGGVDEERWWCHSGGDDGLSDAWPTAGGRKNGRKEEEASKNCGEGGDTGFESHPPMLNKENYVPWSSRLLRYAKSRPNGKLIHNSILNGPYVRRMIPEPGDVNRDVNVTETFHLQTDDELSDKEIKQIEADDQAIQTILLGLPEDINAAVNSCETAQEIWLRV
nr:hypothetical protein [Tanacetum cinerariifolium]